MEERIERLENIVALQERTMEKLSDTIFDQQKQIDLLERKVEALIAKVKEVDAAMDSDGPHDVPPPHYNG